MRIELDERDVRTFAATLRAYLPDLRREVSRTDNKSVRHQLAERQDLCERLLAQVESEVVSHR